MLIDNITEQTIKKYESNENEKERRPTLSSKKLQRAESSSRKSNQRQTSTATTAAVKSDKRRDKFKLVASRRG